LSASGRVEFRQASNERRTLQAEIDECQDLERRACIEEFAETVRSRIEAKTRKIADLEKRNEELEMKLVDATAVPVDLNPHSRFWRKMPGAKLMDGDIFGAVAIARA
jgi:hypothetical protein